MSNTLKFMKLDLYAIKPYFSLKTIIILIVVLAVTTIGTNNSAFTTGFLMLFATVFTSYTFAIEETSSMDILYGILPISKKNIVVGRYIFAFYA